MSRLFSKKWSPFLLLGLATLLVWGHTVTFGFVWDDEFFIRDLQSVRSLKNVPAMFCSIEAQASDPYLFRVFRPIRTAHYALLHALDGHAEPQPWIFHLANVVWHGATAMMLFAVLCLLLPKLREGWPEGEARWWAFLITLGFTVHPVVSEVVCWAKGLDDILAAFFTLACFRELLLPPENRAAGWRALLWFALAVYSKESAVPFAVIPFFVYRHLHRLDWRVAAQRTFLFLLVALVYMAHRGYVIERNSQAAPLSGSYAQTLVDMLPVVTKYFRLLWGVPPFFIDYKFMKGGYSPLSPDVLVGATLLLALVIGGLLAWRSARLKAVGFGLLWVGLFLLPVSNLLPMMQYMAERFLYLPLIGWLLAAAALAAVAPRAKLFKAVALGLVMLWAVTAWQRSLIWRDELSLFVRSVMDGQPAARLEHNAVSAILHLPHIARAFMIDPKTDVMSFTPPPDERSQRELQETLVEALRLLPDSHTLLSCYGICLASLGRPDQALPYFEKTTRIRPKNADYWLNYARALLAVRQFEPARVAAAHAAALSPRHPLVLSLQTAVEFKAGAFVAAREIALRWRELQPNDENGRLLAEIEKKLAEKNSH